MILRHIGAATWESTPTRQVDPTWSLPKMIHLRAQEHPGQVAIGWHDAVGVWRPMTINDFARRIDDFGRGLIGLGVEAGSRITILASASYEWALIDPAYLLCGAVTVPIYETDSAAQITHILADSDISLVFTATSQQTGLVRSVADESVRIMALDQGAECEIAEAPLGVEQSVLEERHDGVELYDLATIIHSSGATGMSKGIELVHGNFIGFFIQAYDFLPELINSPKSRSLLFLPVVHSLARFVMYALFTGQGRLAFAPDTRNLPSDIATFKPTTLLVVPRVLGKVYNAATAKAGQGFKGSVFSWAAKQTRALSRSTIYAPALEIEVTPGVGVSIAGTSQITDPDVAGSPGPSFGLSTRTKIADMLALEKVKAALGPNLHTIICGSVPLVADLAHFYRGLGLTLLQGYGFTETTGPTAVERPNDFPPDSVGFPRPGNSIRIIEDGEILLKGACMSKGYHNLPEETAQAFQDGWFKPGDFGAIDSTGYLRITGRRKGLIITVGGKNVSPEILEDSLQTHPLISSVVVIGDNRPHIGAPITLDTEMLSVWLKSKGLDTVDPAAAAGLPLMCGSLDRAIARADERVSRAESIRRYRIVNAAFAVESGHLTLSLKLKRRAVLRGYVSEIDVLYADASQKEA